MKALVRWGAMPGLAAVNRTRIDWATEFDWRSLGWSKPLPPVPLIYLGTPGEKRKAVLHLIDSKSGLCELIVKVPMTPAACQAIAHEARTLRELERDGFSAAPRLVCFDQRRRVSSQTVVRGTHCGTQFSRELAYLLHSLVLPNQTITMRQVAEQLAMEKERFELETSDAELVANALGEVADDSQLPAARIHGDFAPWNIKLQPDGVAVLVDWEEARERGLPLHDAYHFVHMNQYLFDRHPQPAFASLRFRLTPVDTAALRWKLEMAYLLDELFRQLSRDNRKHAAFLVATLRLTMAARP